MRQVWLTARRDFTHADRSYVQGEVFSASPLVAVQLRTRRAVEFAKAPAPAAPEPVKPPVTRRRATPKTPIAPAVQAEPDVPAESSPVDPPSEDHVHETRDVYDALNAAPGRADEE